MTGYRTTMIASLTLLALMCSTCSAHAQEKDAGSRNRKLDVPDVPTQQFLWKRFDGNPVFPATPGTWRESQTANPDLLLRGSTYYMYFRGQRDGHDRIGVATIPKEKFDGVTWNIHPESIIDVGVPGSWDEQHALDPAAIEFQGKVFLYYTGSSPLADRSICLAVSEDGIHFKKYDKNPVVIGGAPEVISRDSILYLYFWKQVPGKQGFQIHYATSRDGYQYTEPENSLALAVGSDGSWDSFTVETPRIFFEKGLYYMVYCGSDRNKDYPFHAGLATSADLVHWRKYEANPIFSRGDEGQWDEGAIWFTTVEKINGRYYMWYEGYGGGTARTVPYGSYLKGGKSQVGMATMDAEYFYVSPDDVGRMPVLDIPQAQEKKAALYDSALARRLHADDWGMKRYVMAFLRKGPNRNQDSATAANLQRAHLENIGRMAKEGQLVLAGPFLDDGNLRGIYIFNVETLEEAEELTKSDPAVKAGRLVMELHPWYGPAALQEVNALSNRLLKPKSKN